MRLSPNSPHNLATLPPVLTGQTGGRGSVQQQQTTTRHAGNGQPRSHSAIAKQHHHSAVEIKAWGGQGSDPRSHGLLRKDSGQVYLKANLGSFHSSRELGVGKLGPERASCNPPWPNLAIA